MKYIEVPCCMECPWIREESFCGITYYSPKDLSAIPEWCPLPNAEDTEKLKAEMDAIRGIVGHPGTNTLPWDCPTHEIISRAYKDWLEALHAANQTAIVEQARADKLEHQNTQLRNHIERMRFDSGRRG